MASSTMQSITARTMATPSLVLYCEIVVLLKGLRYLLKPTPSNACVYCLFELNMMAQEAQQRGLPGIGALGMQGMPATPAPGAFPGAMPGSSGPTLMPGMQSAEQATGINMKTGKRGK